MTVHDISLVPFLTAGVVATVVAAAVPLTPDALTPAAEERRSTSRLASRYPADSLVPVIIRRDVFRLTRRPATVAYDPRTGVVPVAPPPPKPVLQVVGLVSGAQPSAVIEGFPGIEGSRVVRVGDVVTGLRVAGITANLVTIVGMDTTWILRVREPWQ